MPATSKAQFRFMHTAIARKKLGAAKAQEFIDATKNVSKLPDKKAKPKK